MEEVMWAGQVCADGGGDVGRSGLCGWRSVMWAGQVCVDGGG